MKSALPPPRIWPELTQLEIYLFGTVTHRFHRQGSLAAFDFFCIVIWKANRAKSRIAERLLERGHTSVETAVASLTREIFRASSDEERLRVIIERWGFRLPMATAVLSVLYPDRFTIYDVRVCRELRGFGTLAQAKRFETIWSGYQDFHQAVVAATPLRLSLRDKDRYLWGKSFATQLAADIARDFSAVSQENDG